MDQVRKVRLGVSVALSLVNKSTESKSTDEDCYLYLLGVSSLIGLLLKEGTVII